MPALALQGTDARVSCGGNEQVKRKRARRQGHEDRAVLGSAFSRPGSEARNAPRNSWRGVVLQTGQVGAPGAFHLAVGEYQGMPEYVFMGSPWDRCGLTCPGLDAVCAHRILAHLFCLVAWSAQVQMPRVRSTRRVNGQRSRVRVVRVLNRAAERGRDDPVAAARLHSAR